MKLQPLGEIFNKKLFRIPDYQRGFAWQAKPQNRQLIDFWTDLMNIGEGKNHYMGVLTLENVPAEKSSTWNDDAWLVNTGYAPVYVVDGQQRLTTAIILIQSILEVASTLPKEDGEEISLNFTTLSEIRNTYISRKKGGSIQRAFVFGYEKDNPSYEYLKTRIFGEPSSSNENKETLYTVNLENAKKFFIDNLKNCPKKEIRSRLEFVFKRVTQQMLFNCFTIEDDIQVFVAFETMNNRGKPLSKLELLKNRLIYLSTLFDDDSSELQKLRVDINNCWKEIYYQLGRNKNQLLNDDDFLRAHWIVYFKYSRQTGNDYINFLLNEEFHPKNVLGEIVPKIEIEEVVEIADWVDDDDDDTPGDTNLFDVSKKRLTIQEISDYITSLQNCAEHWYNTFNPIGNERITVEEQEWMDKLNRIGITYFRPLVLSAFAAKSVSPEERIRLFKAIERFIFVVFRMSETRGNYRSSEFYNLSRELYFERTTVDYIISVLEQRMSFTFNEHGTYISAGFQEIIRKKFETSNQQGYYGWSGLRYLLYEYELSLMQQSKTSNQKIKWADFVNQKDVVSVEHIYPQTPAKCWESHFKTKSEKKRNALTNTLGNLLALAQPKNSALQNDCYDQKRADKNTLRGYFNGSYSENRVAKLYPEWTPETVMHRGLEMLKFLEDRWEVSLGGKSDKLEILYLGFMAE